MTCSQAHCLHPAHLRNRANPGPEALHGQLPEVMPTDAHSACAGVIEPEQQAQQCALARAAGAHHCAAGAGGNCQRHVLQACMGGAGCQQVMYSSSLMTAPPGAHSCRADFAGDHERRVLQAQTV